MAHKKNSQGQALVEFALIITVLLMMMFLIIESARILWAWNTVQNAAREGARYAITGQFTDPCDSAQLPKFTDICDGTETETLRVASIINVAHQGLSGLPLNETSGAFEDDYYYQIEVWGVNDQYTFQKDFGGIPNQPVIVRAFYRVPIITPLLQPILPSIPVFGQVTMNNESFGQLGNANQGQGVPPELPPIATAGVTPSPTFTPTNTPSPTPGPTSTETPTPTYTPSPTPDYCGLEFEEPPIAGNNYVYITGEIGRVVTIIDATTGLTLGQETLLDRNNHACPGFLSVPLTGSLVNGHLILAESDNISDNFATAWVLPGTPTPTVSPTNTVAPTQPATATPTQTLTPTPSGPYISLQPNCGSAPNVQFTVQGFNWPQNTTISLYWNGTQLQSTINTGSQTSFSQTWQKFGLEDGQTYQVVAAASGISQKTATFKTPCDNVTATPMTSTPTPSPAPADLLIVGPPELISTPPIVAYQPVDFRVVISNTGDIPVESQFFVDVFLDPTTVLTNSIPINQSGGYQGIGSLAGRESRAITISVPLGFKNESANNDANHEVYGMVDSLEQINESDETNNISAQLLYNQVTPAPTPTPIATPVAGADNIVGIVYRPSDKGLSPLLRARVLLVDVSTSNIVGTTTSDPLTGIYQFNNLPTATYTVMACGSLSMDLGTVEYFGWRTSITLPYGYPVNIYTDDSVACPPAFP
jgi:hypothetical protein